MIALQIQDIKNFMSRLLLSQTFDNFLLVEGTIITYNTFRIDGRVHKNFFTEEELEDNNLNNREFSLWKEVKPLCLELIKGKRRLLDSDLPFSCLRKIPENSFPPPELPLFLRKMYLDFY